MDSVDLRVKPEETSDCCCDGRLHLLLYGYSTISEAKQWKAVLNSDEDGLCFLELHRICCVFFNAIFKLGNLEFQGQLTSGFPRAQNNT